MKALITFLAVLIFSFSAFTQNFGIGTSTPTRLLHLGNTAGGTNIIGLGSPAGSDGPHGIDFLESADGSVGLSLYYRTSPKNLYIENASGSQLVTFTQGGNVGIGTTNPQVKLDVDGDIRTKGFVRNCPSGFEQIGVFCISLTCRGPNTRADAISACQALGGRLCAAGEVLSTSGRGCGYDSTPVWVDGVTSRAFIRGNQSTSIGWANPSNTEYYCCY